MSLDASVNVETMMQTLQTTLDFESKLDKRFSFDNKNKFHRFISSCFDPYLDHYIHEEER